ncbi:DUF4199 domain-containing protein [Urechidicola croceus]|uniref:DUF4199 domain-containing protein n=1 Tax=Urechidicola croceus TaxID=1850246 RepID=A0A1D8P8Q2_9FLAO|nr:DUF4199 domain-containing protein [Urechidicola croceus]AOW20965.1 hypothetical protein LPB138_09885 [Urechidicola croceus]
MKQSILKFGGYGALTGGIIFMGSHFFSGKIDMGLLEIFGYISIFASLSFVFFGIKHFRDQFNNGTITFGKAIIIGLAISAIVGITIGILDIIYVTIINPNFANEYVQYTLDGMKKTLSPEVFEIQKAQLLEEMKAYDNPAFAGLFMFGIIFAIGMIISIISALILQRKN